MAKDNLFLGMARGSIGDVVLYRASGQQISRARNRHPANPRTAKQNVQRAVMASVSRLYSVGREIFDHSWQGEKVGSGSQRGFLRDNAPLLRSLLVGEINAAALPEDARSRVSAPGISVAVPFDGMKISNGNYAQQFFARIIDQTGGMTSYKAPAPLEGESIAEYAQRNGLIPGDIYTALGIGVGVMSGGNIVYDANDGSESSPSDYKRVYQSRLSYCQLLVRADIASATETISAATTLGDIFTLYEASGPGSDLSNKLLSAEFALPDIDDVYVNGVLGVIRSREDSGVRSLSYAYFSGGSDFGLTPDLAIDVWSRESQSLAGAELILEGENFQ